VAPARSGEGGIRRGAEYKDAILEYLDPKITTLVEMWQ
jgi:hypothetical protein